MQLSGAARALGHHWGTFHLTNEAIEQPRLPAAARAERGMAPTTSRRCGPVRCT